MEKKNCITVFLQGRCQFQTSELSQLKKVCKRKVAVNCFWQRWMRQGEVTKRNPVFLLPPKCHFSVCFCSKWQSLHARKYTLQTYTVLTWLTFHLRILFEYKKIDTCVEKAPNGANLQHIYAWKKVKTVCILSTLAAKNGCQNKSVFPSRHSAEYILNHVHSFIAFILSSTLNQTQTS